MLPKQKVFVGTWFQTAFFQVCWSASFRIEITRSMASFADQSRHWLPELSREPHWCMFNVWYKRICYQNTASDLNLQEYSSLNSRSVWGTIAARLISRVALMKINDNHELELYRAHTPHAHCAIYKSAFVAAAKRVPWALLTTFTSP